MAILGTVIKRGMRLRKTMAKIRRAQNPQQLQHKTLLKLLKKARNTAFGKHYGFEGILTSINPEKAFQEVVPIHTYNKIYEEWWHKTRNGETNICWPGKVKYYALSSGTSGAASKHLPITSAMIKAMRKTTARQLLSLVNYNIKEEVFEKGVLVVGGSSSLQKMGHYFQGDLSGINQAKMPFWTYRFYKPGKGIAKQQDWNQRIEEIVKKAPKWDIALITGVPAWNQIILEKIIERYKLNHIHEIWPNLTAFIYGGVSIQPYKNSLNEMFGKPVYFLETYLASEGFIAYQNQENAKGMAPVLNNGIFMEFIPFNADNFDEKGQLNPNAKPILIGDVLPDTDYAILLSTNAGAWRYLIGDTVKFITVGSVMQMIVTGRISHFLSLCGEHLSLENMNEAISLTSTDLNVNIKEFTVCGIEVGTLFGHKWYLGIDETVDKTALAKRLDHHLCLLNADYATEREHVLKTIIVETVPNDFFYEYMEQQGRLGSQNKFPRVMQKQQFDEWETFVKRL